MTRKSSTETLIAAMRILARDIQSGDGVANAAIAEAADRLEELQASIAELDGRINILLEQRNKLGQDVQNAAITGVVPENHAIGAQLGLVANMRAKLADLARKAAHDVTLTNEGNITDHLRGATKMVTDRQLADAVNELRDIAIKFHAAGQLRERIAGVVRGLVRGEPDTVPVNREALDALREALQTLDEIRDMVRRRKVSTVKRDVAAGYVINRAWLLIRGDE